MKTSNYEQYLTWLNYFLTETNNRTWKKGKRKPKEKFMIFPFHKNLNNIHCEGIGILYMDDDMVANLEL